MKYFTWAFFALNDNDNLIWRRARGFRLQKS
jgi:hypothetical protein